MDVFAHYLWSYGIFFKEKKAWLFGIIGVLPDLVSFGPHFFYSIFNGFSFGPPTDIPRYIYDIYNFTHSFIIFLTVFFMFYLLLRKYAIFLIPWGIHVLIDIPTHTQRFFPTPFLWPISDFTVSGISWASLWFMVLNYGLIFFLFLFRFIQKYKKK